jgi:hypothetical protein
LKSIAEEDDELEKTMGGICVERRRRRRRIWVRRRTKRNGTLASHAREHIRSIQKRAGELGAHTSTRRRRRRRRRIHQ